MNSQEKNTAIKEDLSTRHARYMRMALLEARRAYELDEVPVGAVLVRGDSILASAHNLCVTKHDPTAHAEMLCLQEGVHLLDGRLSDCELYVTLEPCIMCAGTMLTARLGTLIFGAFDPRVGCCGSVLDVTDHCFYHSVPVWSGIMEQECAALLSEFFSGKRPNAPVQNVWKQENEK